MLLVLFIAHLKVFIFLTLSHKHTYFRVLVLFLLSLWSHLCLLKYTWWNHSISFFGWNKHLYVSLSFFFFFFLQIILWNKSQNNNTGAVFGWGSYFYKWLRQLPFVPILSSSQMFCLVQISIGLLNIRINLCVCTRYGTYLFNVVLNLR